MITSYAEKIDNPFQKHARFESPSSCRTPARHALMASTIRQRIVQKTFELHQTISQREADGKALENVMGHLRLKLNIFQTIGYSNF